ncbi:polyphosphate kinase 1 [Kushneria phosphatilytica]|uniref:Polyphosphate kinase n=1 Tax=Kushneria phosphatilytica TaxID=657387 RepID=A0A142G9M8_9GAMM|nr:polyphosphate kinase 1 [Kushneria phosphatilytica]AMR00665.1 polyphosphate kinase [Kushneria phosphatilytica]OHV10492.1 RNA degradosome polyphosphate kinase [Kushneria phosphatilytica]QEL11954.1 polyphosphate kinase 1 [Kushneria phosphatilytica]
MAASSANETDYQGEAGESTTTGLRINRSKTGVRASTPSDNIPELDDPRLYFNRELSTLQFHIRVLEQALDESHPLLDRLMFLLIFSSNLDEFFEIRVAGLKHRIAFGHEEPSVDGHSPSSVFAEIARLAHEQVERQYHILNNHLIPALADQGIHFLRRTQWTKAQQAWVHEYFDDEIMPVVSPIGLDPSHPFPRLVNKSLNFIVELEGHDAFGRTGGMAIIPAPRSLPRLIRVPDSLGREGCQEYVFLSSMIHAHASKLFPGMTIRGCYQFRLTRNADLSVDTEDVSDLASALKGELLARRYGDGVRLEVANNCPEHLSDFLLAQFRLDRRDLYLVDGPVNLSRLMSMIGDSDRHDLRYTPFTPGLPKVLKSDESLFDIITREDVLLLHPWESFSVIENWLAEAARDPNVLAIKQTLYRTGADSGVVNALVDAARNGKEVTVVIELRARFDEADNIALASRLQEAGANVIYGVMAYKTHAKMLHIVRRESGQIRHYAHMGTGNYHAKTARLYTDYSLMTAREALCEDVHHVFQQLSGMGEPRHTEHILHAPFILHSRLIEMIDREARNAHKGRKSHLIIKCNSLTEPQLIRALYRASQAGVQCDLIIRGTCCLRPGVAGVSENITVRSIVGRFLEHTRVYHFHNAGKPETWCSSADFMERNMFNRVETCFPLLDRRIAKRVRKDLDTYMLDNCQSWQLQSDGHYEKRQPGEGEAAISAQETLLYAYSARA